MVLIVLDQCLLDSGGGDENVMMRLWRAFIALFVHCVAVGDSAASLLLLPLKVKQVHCMWLSVSL